jgi:hypothetical protein
MALNGVVFIKSYGKSVRFNTEISENADASGETFRNFPVSLQASVIAYCKGCEAIYLPAATVQSDRQLQQCAELHCLDCHKDISYLTAGVEKV